MGSGQPRRFPSIGTKHHPAPRSGGILRRFIAARRGAVALEFALGFPIFLAMIYGVFEFGRIVWTRNTMEFAIEEAARFAMVNPNAANAQISTLVEDNAVGLDVALIDVKVDFEQDNTGPGNGPRTFVNITGTYDYAPIVPLVIPTMAGGGIDFTKLQMDIVSTTRMALVIP